MPQIYSCPHCATVIVPQEAGYVCPTCRKPLPQSAIDTVMPEDVPGAEDATRLAPPERLTGQGTRSPRDSRPTSSSGWLSSSGAIDHGRFEPGTLLGGRYRIIGRLGRGGMGEVYRADDLKLGQAVALKFLPADVDRDPARLTQLHTEVRMARQVSHPHVCRVYDIDEIDGTTFLSMEYVDGEDLASLLKRVGRFPEDRALEIARQICAGLAAAHERNVIHRDLKPANVMLDGTGKVRITDFGLAGASGEAIRAGTPAYMAPEQLSGGEVTARSDIYALGLVLYELFTGQRALDGKNLAELIHKREQSGILAPQAIVKSLDARIDETIMRCLRPAEAERPQSALAVAAALPGGDPLAAALAAGETPSPEMVAAAGSREALTFRATMVAATWMVVSMVAVVLMYQRVILLNRVLLPKSPAALEDRAREALALLGYDPAAAADSAWGLGISEDYAAYINETSTAENRWDSLRTVRPETFFAWYRTSPQLLVPWGSDRQISRANPPLTTAGMTLVAVDASGRLSEFHAVPQPRGPGTPPTPTDWGGLFRAAGLPIEQFAESTPQIVPPFYADERRAWEGPLPDRPEHRIRVEAAAASGKPVYFAIAGPWSRFSRGGDNAPSRFTQVIGEIASIVMPCLMVVGALLARANINAGRGDRVGAFRVATFVFATSLLSWLLGASHIESISVEVGRVFSTIGAALFAAGLMWLTYLGIEPYIRRHAPDSILGWTRLLAGHWRDPRVGVDVTIGVSAGLAMTVLYAAHNLLPALAGHLEPMPLIPAEEGLVGVRQLLSGITAKLTESVVSGMLGVSGVVGLALLFRNRWLAIVTAIIVFTPVAIRGMFNEGTPTLDLAIGAAIITTFVAVIVRAGLLSAIVALFSHFVLLRAPITTDFASWHASFGLWHIGVVLALGLGACYYARTGITSKATRATTS